MGLAIALSRIFMGGWIALMGLAVGHPIGLALAAVGGYLALGTVWQIIVQVDDKVCASEKPATQKGQVFREPQPQPNRPKLAQPRKAQLEHNLYARYAGRTGRDVAPRRSSEKDAALEGGVIEGDFRAEHRPVKY